MVSCSLSCSRAGERLCENRMIPCRSHARRRAWPWAVARGRCVRGRPPQSARPCPIRSLDLVFICALCVTVIYMHMHMHTHVRYGYTVCMLVSSQEQTSEERALFIQRLRPHTSGPHARSTSAGRALRTPPAWPRPLGLVSARDVRLRGCALTPPAVGVRNRGDGGALNGPAGRRPRRAHASRSSRRG